LKPSVTKAIFLEKLSNQIKKAVEEEATDFLMMYSGHGHQSTGGWIV